MFAQKEAWGVHVLQRKAATCHVPGDPPPPPLLGGCPGGWGDTLLQPGFRARAAENQHPEFSMSSQLERVSLLEIRAYRWTSPISNIHLSLKK